MLSNCIHLLYSKNVLLNSTVRLYSRDDGEVDVDVDVDGDVNVNVDGDGDGDLSTITAPQVQ